MLSNMIQFTAGDSANLVFTAEDGDGNPVNLTGAVFTTFFRIANGLTVQFDNSQHTANPDQINFPGQYTLALAVSDTAPIPPGDNKEVITEVVQGGSTIYYHGPNILNVLSPIPRK